jgi:serine/threonine protein kinase
MGVVWLAHDKRLREPVALKFLPTQVSSDVVALEDLRRETLRSRKLSHPNIIRIHDLHEVPNEPAFISMEYVDGPDLHTLRARRPAEVLTWKFLAPLVRQLCGALEYAHGEGVIHRDIKPANLMLDSNGRLKLADFGLACVVHDSMSRISGRMLGAGTLSYMSPQQADGQKPGVADDIYALGATLYELLTSRPPFYTGDIAYQVRNTRPQPMPERLLEMGLNNEIPSEVEAFIMACLAKESAQRPQNARVILDWVGGLENRASGTPSSPFLTTGPAPAQEPSESRSQPQEIASAPELVETASREFDDNKPSSPNFEPQALPPVQIREQGGGFTKQVLALMAVVLMLGIGIGIWLGMKSRSNMPTAAPPLNPIAALDEGRSAEVPATAAIAPGTPGNAGAPEMVIPTTSPQAQAQLGAFKDLFNGRDLSGWDGEKRFWSVVDGAIRGRLTEPLLGRVANTALIYRGAVVDDFELHLRFRCGPWNYSILYRGSEQPKFEVLGYECIIWVQASMVGRVHDHGMGIIRSLTLDGKTPPPAKSWTAFKTNDWNDLVIIAQGSTIRQELNGLVTMETQDANLNQMRRSGILALAIYPGYPRTDNRIEFKDIRLRRLSTASLSRQP